MGDASRFLSGFFKVFRKAEISEGNGKRTRIRNTAALPEGISRQFSLAEIKAATDNFHQELVIGRGGFGRVYIGFFDDGKLVVAVKRLDPESRQGRNEFQTEVQLLCQLRHQNLVSLIGFCDEKDEMILVYEYMRNGTLRDHLYYCGTRYDPLPWRQRLHICMCAARGFHYLHTGTKHVVIHRDVKSSNILLDENWVCKLCDFGLSKMRFLDKSSKALKKINSLVKGTFGYLDPEYARGHDLTEKSDVYSFGVLLFEVLCARKALDRNLNEGAVNLANWARRCTEEGTIYKNIDPYLMGRIAPECFNIFVDIAYGCTSLKGNTRPEMGEVEVMLELALEMQEKADSEQLHLDSEEVPVSDHGFCAGSSNTSLGSLDTNCGLDASWNQVEDDLSSKPTIDDLCPCESSTNENKMDLEPLNSLVELSRESKWKMVEDMKNHFIDPVTKFLCSAHDLHDIGAQRAGLQLLLTFLSQNRY